MSASPEQRQYGRFYPLAHRVMRPATSLLWRIDVQGLDNLPSDGPAIIAANHVSFLDSAFLMARLDRRITFVGKAEYMDSWKTKHLFPNIGMIPIDRSGGGASTAALDAAAEVLDRGELFGIFPEGTRSRTGVLYKGRTGAARLSRRTGAPLIPVGIVGTERIQPPDARMPKLFQSCSITFGSPINPARYGTNEHDPRIHRRMTDELMFEIRELTCQHYLNEYAPASTPATTPPIYDSSAGDSSGNYASTGMDDATSSSASGNGSTMSQNAVTAFD